MKYAVTVAGEYKALVDIELDGKGGFTGRITSDKYGITQIENGFATAGYLTGTATFDGHDAEFTAKIDGQNVSGTIKAVKVFGAWLHSETFEGFQTT